MCYALAFQSHPLYFSFPLILFIYLEERWSFQSKDTRKRTERRSGRRERSRLSKRGKREKGERCFIAGLINGWSFIFPRISVASVPQFANLFAQNKLIEWCTALICLQSLSACMFHTLNLYAIAQISYSLFYKTVRWCIIEIKTWTTDKIKMQVVPEFT